MNIIELGVVREIIDETVVVETSHSHVPLDEESILCFEDRKILGRVFEIFGPVAKPLYSVKFNTADEIDHEATYPGAKVFFTPEV